MYLRITIVLFVCILFATSSQASGHEHHASMNAPSEETASSQEMSSGAIPIAVCLTTTSESDSDHSHDDCLGCCTNHGGAKEALSAPRMVVGKGNVVHSKGLILPSSSGKELSQWSRKLPGLTSPESGNVLRL